MLSVGYGRLKTKLVKRLCSVMQEIAVHVEQEQDKIMQMFTGHCSVLIQKHIRRYLA